MNTTIIIQGPISSLSLWNLDKYTALGNVIVSTTDMPNDEYIGEYKNLGLVVSPLPDRPYYTNAHHIFEHAWTVYKALRITDTGYAVKVRSDEKYDNLGFFIEEMKKNYNKITTCNIFFKKSSKEPFHPSDHIIGSTTINMMATFESLVEKCLRSPTMQFIGSDFGVPWMGPVAPETAICLSFLKSQNVLCQLPAHRSDEAISEIMKTYFHLVDINKLGPYVWTKKIESGRGFYDNFDDNDESIFDIEEV